LISHVNYDIDEFNNFLDDGIDENRKSSPIFNDNKGKNYSYSIKRNNSEAQNYVEEMKINAKIKNKRKITKRPQSAFPHGKDSPTNLSNHEDKAKDIYLKRNLATYENWFGKNPLSLKDLLVEACDN
jgi:hypothetical protein